MLASEWLTDASAAASARSIAGNLAAVVSETLALLWRAEMSRLEERRIQGPRC